MTISPSLTAQPMNDFPVERRLRADGGWTYVFADKSSVKDSDLPFSKVWAFNDHLRVREN